MLTCRELIDFLDRYVAGELTQQERGEFDRHLRLCADCRVYLDSYRATIGLAKRCLCEGDTPAPADVPPGIIKAILSARKQVH